jgi:hypothetical protein
MNPSSYKGGPLPARASCGDSHYEETDPAKLPTLPTTDVATAHWYGGKAFYDFKAGTYKPKLKALIATPPTAATALKQMNTQKDLADAFTRMVWKATTTVAFGIKGRWVYARYCSVQGNQGGTAGFITNVKQDCVKDDVDVCFQAAALKAHNEKRARHKKGRPLAADPAASNHIQKVLAQGNFGGEFNLPS